MTEGPVDGPVVNPTEGSAAPKPAAPPPAADADSAAMASLRAAWAWVSLAAATAGFASRPGAPEVPTSEPLSSVTLRMTAVRMATMPKEMTIAMAPACPLSP
jgi:hypothetical protein